MSSVTWTLRTTLATLACTAIAIPALAGPPLLCHPFDIGGAKSLPWGDGHAWLAASPGYRVSNLVADTQALLDPSAPVIVRMETLRRAAIYASRDARVAAELFKALTTRARAAEQAGRPDPLAYLDAAYFIEAIRQVSQLSQPGQFGDQAPMLRAIVQGEDGYPLAEKGLALRPGEPAMEFEVALIAAERRRDAYPVHAERARAGVRRDALLARNIDHVQ